MARPTKPDEKKRTKKLVVYLTDQEDRAVKELAETEQKKRAEIGYEGLQMLMKAKGGETVGYESSGGASLTGALGGADIVRQERDDRLTVYLTDEDLADEERGVLSNVSERESRPITQLVVTAVREWVNRLVDPPESLRKAKYEKIMQQNSEMLRGYVCRNGHPFWIEWATATEPRRCPVCGSEREIKRTWYGTIKRG